MPDHQADKVKGLSPRMKASAKDQEVRVRRLGCAPGRVEDGLGHNLRAMVGDPRIRGRMPGQAADIELGKRSANRRSSHGLNFLEGHSKYHVSKHYTAPPKVP